MDNLENGTKNQLNTIKTESNNPPLVKPIKKKKKMEMKKQKKCMGLKELLEQIVQDKYKKGKKSEKENAETNINNETQIKSSHKESKDKNKDLVKDYINIFNSSISSTTVTSLSPDDFNELQKFNFDKNIGNLNKNEYLELKQNYLMKNLEISKEEKITEEKLLYNEKKMSSPICDYYQGWDKFLSKTYKGSIDMTNSKNFIKKKDFITSISYLKNNELNNYINPYIKNHKNNNHSNSNYGQNDIIATNTCIIHNNDEKKEDKINNKVEFEHKFCKNMFNDGEYINIPYADYEDCYYNKIPENNLILDFTILNNYKSENFIEFHEKNKIIQISKFNENHNNKKDKPLQIREGDWLCNYCHNLNFSFRVLCNRCKKPKEQL